MALAGRGPSSLPQPPSPGEEGDNLTLISGDHVFTADVTIENSLLEKRRGLARAHPHSVCSVWGKKSGEEPKRTSHDRELN